MTQDERIRELIDKYVPCTCGEVYLSRGMTAPDCGAHSVNIEDVAIDYAQSQAIAFGVFCGFGSKAQLERLYPLFLTHQSQDK